MKIHPKTRKARSSSSIQVPLRLSGLQARMTISYVWVTVVSVLLLEMLIVVVLTVAAYPLLTPLFISPIVRQKAEQYALAASLEAHGSSLNTDASFLPHRPGSLVLPGGNSTNDLTRIEYLTAREPDKQGVSFALLIAPNGQIVASSYPGRYAVNTSVSTLLSDRTQTIANALAGTSSTHTFSAPAGQVVYATAPVWSKDEKIIGTIYVEIPAMQPLNKISDAHPIIGGLLASSLILLIITAPIGGLFGVITTRGLVKRIHTLVTATTRFADGDYNQRVTPGRLDEVGQLEEQFNRMAGQLVESINTRQDLAEQNARMAERSRISRELHDAISQDLFSLRMLTGGLQTAIPTSSPLYPQIMMLKQSTTTMIREMRALLLELRPTQLEQMGLAAALEDLAAAYRARLNIEVKTSIQKIQLPAQAEHMFLRVAQEALTNAARHADATIITLELASQDNQISFTITDNGQGFDPNVSETQHGLGIQAMRERVNELLLQPTFTAGAGTNLNKNKLRTDVFTGGSFDLQSTPGKGTSITITLIQKRIGHDTYTHR